MFKLKKILKSAKANHWDMFESITKRIFKTSIDTKNMCIDTMHKTLKCIDTMNISIDTYCWVSILSPWVSIQSLAVAQLGMKPSNVSIQVCMYRYLLMSIDTHPRSIDTELGNSLRLAETLICIDTKVHVSIQLA